MPTDKDIKDLLRVLETFEKERPKEYMSKHRLGQLFVERFDEAGLKQVVRHALQQKYIDCIEYGDFADFRIRITALGSDSLQAKAKEKATKAPLSKKLLWIIIGVALYGLAHYIYIRITQR
jgi:hypothetical protein